jgi:hypothetical protein
MKNELLTIANIFGWTANDIQLDEQFDYYKNLIKDDAKAITDNRLFLRNYSTPSTIMSYFVDLMHEASSFLDAETPFIIANTATNIAYKNFEDMAKHQNRIKNRLVDDRAFLINFEATRYDYELFKLM